MGVLDVLMENIFPYPLANPAVSTKGMWNLIWKSLHGQALRECSARKSRVPRSAVIPGSSSIPPASVPLLSSLALSGFCRAQGHTF